MPTALIVGASRGLGLAMADAYLKRGWNVIATVRDSDGLKPERAQWGDRLRVEILDTTDWAGIDMLKLRLTGTRLDLLFVNAGIMDSGLPIGDVPPDVFDDVMRVNALAPLRLIDRFVSLMAPGGLIGAMSSHLASIADSFGRYDGYRMSKAALNMGLKSLAMRRAEEGLTFVAAAPGWVRTELGGPEAPLTVDESIPRLVDVIEGLRDRGGIHFVDYEGRELNW